MLKGCKWNCWGTFGQLGLSLIYVSFIYLATTHSQHRSEVEEDSESEKNTNTGGNSERPGGPQHLQVPNTTKLLGDMA